MDGITTSCVDKTLYSLPHRLLRTNRDCAPIRWNASSMRCALGMLGSFTLIVHSQHLDRCSGTQDLYISVRGQQSSSLDLVEILCVLRLEEAHCRRS